jgi:hypothetical protein
MLYVPWWLFRSDLFGGCNLHRPVCLPVDVWIALDVLLE